ETRLADYAAAISVRTGALMRVHTSNFTIVGCTQQPSFLELVALARTKGIPLIDNLGNGSLIDLTHWGLEGTPLIGDSIRAGADLVLLSGDKLLGGPQCGIILGRQSLLTTI